MKKQTPSIEKIHARTTYPHCKDIITFFEAVQNDRKAKALSCFNYDVAIKYLKLFALENEINFKGINREWMKRFREFLLSTPSLKNERTLSFNSASTYFSIVLSIINEAIQNHLLEPDVIKNLKPIKRGYLKTEALSAQELSRLAEAECDCVVLKKAFLLSALTGIQWKELKLITWTNVIKNENVYELNLPGIRDARTVPLTIQAFGLLPETKERNTKLFDGLKWNSYLYVKLNKWAIRAGVLRNITFQSGRLTFARLLHVQGVPTEIIGELLGHRNSKSTLRLTEQYLSAIS